MNDIQHPAVSGARSDSATAMWLQQYLKLPTAATVREFVVLFVVTIFLLLYGLVPVFGGDQLGLVGADEPRYAQIAREMLTAHSEACHEVNAKMFPRSLRIEDLRNSFHCIAGGTVTPILYGKPWLEKPALYYWRAMSFFKEFGVSDWTARLPSSSATLALVVLVFLHMRRFRPGGHLDAALITASCVAIVSFARGASTDMQLAAPFCIGMLGWYAWYETGKKFWLFDLYFFGAAATLAKGPVAPFLALSIILLFAGLRREWSLLRRTIWWPGILLYLLMVLPWYLAVQKRNPTFYQPLLSRTQSRALRHQPLSTSSAVLVLRSPFLLHRPDAVDRHRHSSPGRLRRSLHRRMEGPPQPAAISWPHTRRRRLSRVPRSLGSLSDRLLFLLGIEACPATFFPPSLHSPSLRPTISTASAAMVCRDGFSGPTPQPAACSSSYLSWPRST